MEGKGGGWRIDGEDDGGGAGWKSRLEEEREGGAE